MYFLQVAQAPLILQLVDPTKPKAKPEQITLSRFPLSEVVAWASELAQQMEERSTEGLDDLRRREYLTMYPVIPPSVDEMKRHVRTPAGIERVLTYSFVAAGKTQEYVQDLMKINGTGRMAKLAWELADMEDKSLEVRPVTSIAQLQGGDGGEQPSPLK
jgi:hypothetical protein